jgi:hypothetical protein
MNRNVYTPALMIMAACLLLVACNTSGLSEKPRATFSQLACLDLNGDGRINDADASNEGDLPDFNADFLRNERDAAFVEGVDIALDPQAEEESCKEGQKRQPEFLVAHDYFSRAEVSCGPGDESVMILGVAGGVDNLREQEDAAGVRAMVDALVKAYEGRGAQTIAVVAGAALYGAQNPHTGMEDWLTNATRVYLDRFPCLDVVLLGFSHGGVTVEVLGARLEEKYRERIAAVVTLDRIESFYMGDLEARPRTAPHINVFQLNTPGLQGEAVEGPNVLNLDASAETGPRDGHEGGPLEPVSHTTIDNSKAVREWIVNVVLGRP